MIIEVFSREDFLLNIYFVMFGNYIGYKQSIFWADRGCILTPYPHGLR